MSDHTSTSAPRPVRLALSSGEIFQGIGFGFVNTDEPISGEVVFNTAMSGYQESLTDPSYKGQILVQTSAMVGNTGMNDTDTESAEIQVRGFVVHEHVDAHSNYRAIASLHQRLHEAGVPGVCDIDTRALTRVLRSRGVTVGVICADGSLPDSALVEHAREAPSMQGADFASGSGVDEQTPWAEGSHEWAHTTPGSDQRVKVGVIDCGSKSNILRSLVDAGADPVLLPMGTNTDVIKGMLLDGRISGVMLSNGAGDPSTLNALISTVRSLIDDPELERFPIYGICLGHQIIAQAIGARTFKLKFGHRGINHPIRDEQGARVLITSQNHGFAVDPDSVDQTRIEITHTHLNDETVGGLRIRGREVACVQFHPEASPGPHDADPFFTRFVSACVSTRAGAGV